MKILVIARYFSPYNHIASVRLTKLAKYFHRSGHQVTVLTANNDDKTLDPILMEDEKEIDTILRVDNSKTYYRIFDAIYGGYKGMAVSVSSSTSEVTTTLAKKAWLLSKIKKYAREWMYIYENVDFARQAREKLPYKLADFDVILSSYGPFSSHILGRYYKKHRCAPQWIADFRDAVEFAGEYSLAGAWSRRYLRQVYADADKITGVSQGVLDELQIPESIPAIVISNAFDPEDMRFVENSDRTEKMFRMVYPGQLYSGKRDLSYVFRSLRELSDEGKLDISAVCVEYAGACFSELCKQADKYRLSSVIRNHGYIDRKASLELQKRSDLLLLASWNNVGNTGIVTGKFLEYLMMRKPIVCTISGNLANSALKEMIEEARVGICCEEAAGEPDYLKLKDFLYKEYCVAMGVRKPDFCPDEESIAKHTYFVKARDFERLF